jgi:hypothetical protein
MVVDRGGAAHRGPRERPMRRQTSLSGAQAMDICRDATVVVRVSISFARSAVVGSDMAEGIDATADGGERAEWVGGTADGDEECLVAKTRLSRALGPRVAGPRLRSS